LDVTVQAEILELLNRLKQTRAIGVLFVSHDLGVIAELCDRVAVFYAGEIVEYGPTDSILRRPQHPYTQAMLAVASLGNYRRRTLEVIPGQPPPVGVAMPGCRFAPRCEHAITQCVQSPRSLIQVSADHEVRCIRAQAQR
jgi:peptide/nickel transport system ATP-binding protein